VLLFLLLLQLQLPPLLLRLLLSRSGAGSSCTLFSAIGVQLGEFHQCHCSFVFPTFLRKFPVLHPVPVCPDALMLFSCRGVQCSLPESAPSKLSTETKARKPGFLGNN